MARVILTSGFASAFAGDVREVDLPAASLLQLIRALDRRHPGLGQFIEEQAALAVDGVLVSDWTAPIAADAEVLVVPRVAGGNRAGASPRR